MEYIPPKRKQVRKQPSLNVMGGRELQPSDEPRMISPDRRKYSSYDQAEMKRPNNNAERARRISTDVYSESRQREESRRRVRPAQPQKKVRPRPTPEPDYIPDIKERRLHERMQDFYDRDEASYRRPSESRRYDDRNYDRYDRRYDERYAPSAKDAYYEDDYYEDDYYVEPRKSAPRKKKKSSGRTFCTLALIIQAILSLALIIILITLGVFSFKMIAIVAAVLIVLWFAIFFAVRARYKPKKKKRR